MPQRPAEPLEDQPGPENTTRDLYRILSHYDQRLDAMTTHGHMVAQQVAELAINMKALEQRIPDLMAKGIVAAVGNPETWAAAKKAMHREAQDAAGGWLLGVVKFMLDKALWGLVFLLAVYWVGGMPALAALLKLKWSTP